LRKKQLKNIILSSVDYHEGIIGLMAGKMTEKYAKPSIVISEGPEISKASARSLPGFNITEFIRFFKKDLLEVGGHPLAAGFALETKKIPLVKIKMQKQAKILLAKKNLEKILQVENVLPIKLLTLETVALVEQFAPFGLANPKPVFALQNATLKNYKLLGRDGEHLKLIVAFAGSNQEYEVLAWRQAALAQKLILGTKLNLAVSLDINSYRGSNRLQLILKDLKPQAN